ncbi:MAG TPA: FAD-binding oxidoreductase [Alphaproteobacteria bacterium]|nr:FAD-binding oxidoreductase [Alphaproteobacteria bacterium]
MPRVSTNFDLVIVGGGVIGSAAAYFLTAHPGFDGRVAVIERDPGYADCTTSRSVGGIRQQFSTRENILLSQFAAEFVKRADEYLAVEDFVTPLEFVEAGYLFLAGDAAVKTMRSNHALQRRCGAAVALLDVADLQSRFPWLDPAGIALGSLGLGNEGWIDPHALLMAFKAKARSLGARYFHDEVTGIETTRARVTGVRLASGETIACAALLNAAGAHAAGIAAMAGIDLPVAPRKRQVFVFECRQHPPECPLVIDPTGMYFRPESGRFLCGISPPGSDDPDIFDHEVDYAPFEETLWPMLARRVPAFEAIKLHSAWACTYAYNTLDQNAIIGPHPEISNFYFANGFSGHGLQQSPGVGRAISELIVDGAYKSIDLTAFGFWRIDANRPIRELNVV